MVYYVDVAHVLHVVHNDAVVSRKATSVVLVFNVRMLPESQVHSSKAQMSYYKWKRGSYCMMTY